MTGERPVLERFDPFNDRFCRDIRNDLSKALMTSLQLLDLTPAQEIAGQYLKTGLQPIHRQYIDDRMERYRRALEAIGSGHIEGPFRRALVLWDEELFFEVHEILEHDWINSSGKTKLVLQAMIRAAGMYVQLDRGNTKGATSMAAKAVAAFEANRSRIPDYLDVDLLLKKLKAVDPNPPKLLENR